MRIGTLSNPEYYNTAYTIANTCTNNFTGVLYLSIYKIYIAPLQGNSQPRPGRK